MANVGFPEPRRVVGGLAGIGSFTLAVALAAAGLVLGGIWLAHRLRAPRPEYPLSGRPAAANLAAAALFAALGASAWWYAGCFDSRPSARPTAPSPGTGR